MIVTINNDRTLVEDPTPVAVNFIIKTMSYKDKSKQYQLKRMSRSPWQRSSPAYKQLQSEVEGKLYEVDPATQTYSVPTGAIDLLFEACSDFSSAQIIDNRKETGAKISLPWQASRPHPMRPYQQEAVDVMLKSHRGVINFATGLGKTLVATYMVQQYKKKTLIVVPGELIAKQFYEEFVKYFGKNKVGLYGGKKKEIKDITIGIAASLTKAVDLFAKHDLGLVIFDETHHTPANTFFEVAAGLAHVGKIFGLTATDYRSDGKDVLITAGCGSVLLRRDIKWGVANGWLAEPIFLVREINTTGRDFKDNKIMSYKEHVLKSDVMKDRIESDARNMMASGKSVLILVDEVAHGKELSEKLNIPFATGIDKKSRDYVDQLNAGEIPGLVGTDGKVGEGTDTRNVDCIVMANFVASKGPVMQAIGRGLRKFGNKTKCLILDYIPMGSTMLSRHGRQRVGFYQEITDKVKVVEI